MQNCSSEIASERRSQLCQEAREQLRINEHFRKNIIRKLAFSIEQEELLPTEWICEEIVRALKGCIYGVGPQYIRKSLDKRYKRKYEKKEQEENAPALNLNQKKVQEESAQQNEDSYREMTRELIHVCKRNARDVCLQELIRENGEKLARISDLEQKVKELQFRRIRVPTGMWVQLQSMESSNASNANIVIENGAYIRLESE